MTKDEFMRLTPEQQEMLGRMDNITELEELAEEAGGWQAEFWAVNIKVVLYATDPVIYMNKSLRSYFGTPDPMTSTAKKCGILRLMPQNFCMRPDGAIDEGRRAAKALDFYFVLNRKGWQEAWGWARSITHDSGGVDLPDYAPGKFRDFEKAAA